MSKKELSKEIKEILKELSEKESKMRFPDSIQTLDAIIKVEENTYNYTKKNCDMTLLGQEQQKLKELIICDDNKDYFEVCNMECTTGKTYTMINSIPYYLDEVAYGKLPKKGILIVLRQISECNKYAEELNTLFKKKIAISITSDEYPDDSYEEAKKIKVKQLSVVQYYPVVFITHSKYQKLCLNNNERKIYTKNRRLLIIDESIDICKIVRLNNTFLDVIMKNVLNMEDIEKLQPLINPIKERMSKANVENNVVHNFKTNNKNLEVLDEIESEENLNKYGASSKEVKKLTSIIRSIYSAISLINVSSYKDKYTDREYKKVEISTVDNRLKMWKLENNIILDASAPLNMKYELDTRLYHNLNLEPVLDHCKWEIKYVWANSTKSAKGIESDKSEETDIYQNIEPKEVDAKKHYRKNFYKYCSQIIKELGENNTLAIGTKLEHIIKVRDEEYPINPFQCKIPMDNIVHYGDITGKREYGDIKNVLVFHTFNYRDTDYILQYIYYSNITELKDGTTFEVRKSYMLDSIPIFVNQKLQMYKEKTMANHLYQAIKRVNREMIYDTRVVIVSIYLGAILYVRDMLTNCECKEYKEYYMKFNDFSNKKDNKEQEEDTFSLFLRRLTTSDIVYDMIEVFENILKNNIPDDLHTTKITEHIIELELKELRNYLGINTKQGSNALANSTIKDFMNENLIIYNKCKFHFILY